MSIPVRLDPIYRGAPTSGALRTLREFHKDQGPFESYILPVSGNMAVAETLVEESVSPLSIICSDSNIYGAMIGYLCDTSKSPDELEFTPISPELETLLLGLPNDGSDAAECARISVALKWCQLAGTNDFMKWQRIDYEGHSAKYFDVYYKAFEAMHHKLNGMSFNLTHPHILLNKYRGDTSAFIWFQQPVSAKTFDPKGLYKWALPSIPKWNPKATTALLGSLADSAATVLTVVSETGDYKGIPGGEWERIYVDDKLKGNKRTYVLSTRKSSVRVMMKRKHAEVPDGMPATYDDHEITAESKVEFIKVRPEVSLYFYDLFVRELGAVKAETYYVFCIDGQVAGALGFFRREYVVKRNPKLYETFGLNITSQRYARLGRLLMKAMCSQEFITQFEIETNPDKLMLPPLTSLRTTCLTKYPEAKKNRGILKLTERKQLENGRYYLIYDTAIHQITIQEVLDEWILKHSGYGRK